MTQAEREIVPGMAVKIAQRMAELRLTPGDFAVSAGLTRQGLADVRAGLRKRYGQKTIFGVADALRWAPDWYERILNGDDPVVLSAPNQTGVQPAALAANSADLSGLSDEDRRYVLNLVERLKGR